MLDRIKDEDKIKYQLYLPKDLIRDIRKGAADENKTQSKYVADLVNPELLPAEALYAFCGWLTTRAERTIMGHKDDAGVVAELIKEFSELNKLDEPRPGWEKNFKMPVNMAAEAEVTGYPVKSDVKAFLKSCDSTDLATITRFLSESERLDYTVGDLRNIILEHRDEMEKEIQAYIDKQAMADPDSMK